MTAVERDDRCIPCLQVSPVTVYFAALLYVEVVNNPKPDDADLQKQAWKDKPLRDLMAIGTHKLCRCCYFGTPPFQIKSWRCSRRDKVAGPQRRRDRSAEVTLAGSPDGNYMKFQPSVPL